MTSQQLSDAISMVTDTITDVLSIITIFPLNILMAAFVSIVAIQVIRAIVEIFRH